MTTKPPFEIDYLQQLVDFMKENELDEIKMSEGDSTIRMRRNLKPTESTYQTLPQQSVVLPQESMQESPVATTPVIDGHIVTSPMVGTFYRSPSPDAEPFIAIGDTVKQGQTICIIEAMKTMNQIEADKDGVVKKIIVGDAQPVEFGEPLIVIE